MYRYTEALEELEIKSYEGDTEVMNLVKEFQKYSHVDIADEIKHLKVITLDSFRD